MQILAARNSGFCNGVRRAVDIALSAAKRHGALRADGPLVHNEQALQMLRAHNVRDDATDDPALPVIIRAHGVGPAKLRALQNSGRTVIDATCPRVAANQRLAAQAAARGCLVLLAGDAGHAECQAVQDWADGSCIIIPDTDAVQTIHTDKPVFLMAQTTFSISGFARIASAVCARWPAAQVQDTICRATHNRQSEAAELARQADIAVVLGGRGSANTRRLAQTAATAGIPVITAQTADELHPAQFAGVRTCAVLSGASTPDWIIRAATERLQSFGDAP